MKKLIVLLLAAMLVCTCFALAACGDAEDTSSVSGNSSASSVSGTSSSTATSSDGSSSAAASTATSSEETSSAASEETSDTSSEESVVETEPEAKPMWVTHYNDALYAEGGGSILTEPYEGAVWWLHFQFTPVEGEDGVFELTEISDGLAAGNAHPLDIPDGGFVYALNYGNDWPTLIKDHPGQYDDREGEPNYRNPSCDAMINTAKTWKVGQKFIFTGLDLENAEKLPTSTPDKEWWEKDDSGKSLYISTATWSIVD